MLFQKDLWCAWKKQANVKIFWFKFFVSRDKCSSIAQAFLKFANVNHNWNIFFSWKIVEKLARLLVRQIEKWHVFGTLARNNEMLARFWQVGTHGTWISNFFQESSLVDLLQNRCSEIFRKINKKTPVPESYF